MAESTSRRLWIVAVLIACAALVVLYLSQRKGDKTKPALSSDSSGQRAAPGSGGAQTVTAKPTAGVGSGDRPTIARDRLRKEYELYKKVSAFPHWSRPLTPDMKFKLEWNKAIVSELPFGEPSSGLKFRFSADRQFVMFGDAYTSWIEVWRGDDRNNRVPIKVKSARIAITGGKLPPGARSLTLTYRDDGRNGDVKAGDHIYTNRFHPSHFDELQKPFNTRIEAMVEAAGDTRQLVRAFSYAPRPMLEVLSITDEIADGSLRVRFRVRTQAKGGYSFEANLLDETGKTPIAYAVKTFHLTAGEHDTELTFFGRTITSSKLPGPYLVRDIRGAFQEPTESQLPMPWFHPQPHTTKAYKVTDFSGAEWDSDERRKKLQHFRRLLGEQ